MSGKPSDRREDLLLATKHQILMENYESLKQDYASLEQRFKHEEEMHAINLRMLKEERDRNHKGEQKKMVEDLEATIDELKNKNEELLVVLEKQEEEQKKRESKFEELAKRFDEIEKECSHLKSLYDDDAKKLKGQGKDNVDLEDDEVFVVLRENHNVNNNNNTVADPIVLSDESDAETDNPTRESNINSPLPVGIKQEEEEGSSGVNSSQAKHSSSSRVKKHSSSSKVKRPSSSSSSSSSSEVYVVPLKRSRDDGYNKTF